MSNGGLAREGVDVDDMLYTKASWSACASRNNKPTRRADVNTQVRTPPKIYGVVPQISLQQRRQRQDRVVVVDDDDQNAQLSEGGMWLFFNPMATRKRKCIAASGLLVQLTIVQHAEEQDQPSPWRIDG